MTSLEFLRFGLFSRGLASSLSKVYSLTRIELDKFQPGVQNVGFGGLLIKRTRNFCIIIIIKQIERWEFKKFFLLKVETHFEHRIYTFISLISD